MAGEMFDECTTGSLIIVPNSILLVHYNAYYHLGRLIFWCLIHELPFPTWFHEFHLNYIMDIPLNYNTLLQEINTSINDMIEKIKNCENNINNILELKEWALNRNIQVYFYTINYFIYFLINLYYNLIVFYI